MTMGLATVRTLRLAGVGALALALSACSMGNMFAPAPGGDSARLANATASPAEMSAAQSAALPAIATECPPIKMRVGCEALFMYANNSKPNPRELNWQAIIEQQSRNCVVSNGKITVKMGVTGRVLLGPAGNIKSTDVPIRFAIERDGTAVFSEKYNIPVQIAAGAQDASFVKVVENVDIPYLGGENIIIWVGFDSRG